MCVVYASITFYKMAVIDESWNYRLEQSRNDTSREFQLRISCLREDILNLNGFKIQDFHCNDNAQSPDDELKTFIEKNKQLRNEIDTKLEELGQKKSRYENFKQDQKLLSQEIKDSHEAFLMAKKYYKKFLKIYYTVESRNNEKETVFLQFFTEAKRESDNYSVRLLRNTKSGSYELLETHPKLKMIDGLKKRLHETNDIPGVLCCIRQAFTKLKKSKKL